MKDPIEQNMYWLLITASIPARQAFTQIGELFGLTYMQMFTLCLVESEEGVAMHSIASMLHCDASNVTGLVDKLATHGFIERFECTGDRRIKLLRLTNKGARTRQLILSELTKTDVDAFSVLTNEEKETLTKLLAKTMAAHRATKHC